MVVRNSFKDSPNYGKWLAGKERRNRGWWLPGGGVDAGEDFVTASKREAAEEANMELEYKGLLAAQMYPINPNHGSKMMRVVLYAEPVSLEAANNPKNFMDSESECAEWKTLAELEEYG